MLDQGVMGGVKAYWMEILRRDVGARDVKSHCRQKNGTASCQHKPGEYGGDDDSEKNCASCQHKPGEYGGDDDSEKK